MPLHNDMPRHYHSRNSQSNSNIDNCSSSSILRSVMNLTGSCYRFKMSCDTKSCGTNSYVPSYSQFCGHLKPNEVSRIWINQSSRRLTSHHISPNIASVLYQTTLLIKAGIIVTRHQNMYSSVELLRAFQCHPEGSKMKKIPNKLKVGRAAFKTIMQTC